MRYFLNSTGLIGLFFSVILNSAYAKEEINGVVDWAQRVDLTIPVEGIVSKVWVNTGQKVKKGQILVELDKRIVQANLRQAKASVAGLQASYEEMRRELQRAQELYDRTVLSDHDLQVAKNNAVIEKSKLERAKAEYVKAQVELEYATLRAPFDSIILHRSVEVGRAIIKLQSYDTLITLASSGKYLARAPLTSTQAALVNIGDAVSVFNRNKSYPAKVVAIKYTNTKIDKKLVLVVEFSSKDKNLHAGTAVKIIF